MKADLRNAEVIIKDGVANLQKGIETVGGKLYLTNQRILFEAHAFNVQSGLTEIEIANLRSVEKSWTKFLGFVPLFPNSLSVYTTQGNEYRFVLFGRDAWAETIAATIQRASGYKDASAR